MPAPARTSNSAIVAAARALLENEGPAGVTMQRVAAEVGVRAPSLYKRVRDHAELMHLVANDVATELGAVLGEAARSSDPAQDLAAIAEAFRSWARANPGAYGLITAPVPDGWRPDPEQNVHMSAAIHAAATSLVGPADALDAARTFVAFAHGFVSLELAGTFRLGGDPATAYRFGITTLIGAMSGASVSPARARRRDETRARVLR